MLQILQLIKENQLRKQSGVTMGWEQNGSRNMRVLENGYE